MTPERYRRIGELFEEALARPPEERRAFLDQACGTESGGDTSLRAEVERLLAHHGGSGTFLNLPAMDAAAMLAQDRAASLTGKRIKNYEILARLGAGGMGEVWLARDTVLERQVALKFLPAQYAQSAERLQRFLREARAAAALNHPNIITIHEIGQADSIYFIATEFIDGVTLRERMAQGRLELAETLAIIRQIARALDTAHRAKIVHRDLKPENVMIRRDGVVKVLDFGLASVTSPAIGVDQPTVTSGAAGSMTNRGAVMGTPRYMSPEQARGLKVDSRTDLFSLGVVFYEMTAGAPPFPGATEAEVFAALLEREPPPLRRLSRNAPLRLERIVGRMLAKDREQRYETIQAFQSDLEQVSLAAPGAGEDSPDRPPAPRSHRPAWLLAALLAAAALGFGFYHWFAGRGASPAEVRFTPLIGEEGTKDFAAFSPEESRIAFAWDGGKNAQFSPRDIYVKVIGTDGPPLRLTTAPEDDIFPVWTPDGKYITFVRVPVQRRDESESNKVIRVPASGGPEQIIGETNTAAAWSPDGKTLAVSHHPAWEDGGGIFLLSPETGRRFRLTTPPPATRDNFPCFSPDGKLIAFTRDFGPTETDLFIVPAGGGVPKQITFDKGRVFGTAWTSDSREIVYAGVRRQGRGMWRVPAAGGAPERVPINGQSPVSPNISRQGTKLVWTEFSSDSDIWLYQGPGFAGRATPGPFGAPVKLPSSSIYEEHSPDFSPDGEKLVFSSGRTGGEELWVSAAGGNNAVRLTTRGGPTGSPRWSPDNKWIAFDSHVGGDGDIYVIGSAGGPWRRLTFEKTAETQPAWSRDGQWIYFKSNRTGSYQIHKMPAAGGPAKQITFHGGFEGFESPDGSIFYYTKARGEYGIYSVPAEGGEEKLVPELSRAGYWRSWGVVKEGIYFIAKESAPRQTIRFFSFATRRVTPLVEVAGEALWWQPGLALSPDGRRLLFAQVEHAKDEIMLMENFR
jgi:Tol biopolymer transport system component